MQWYQVIIKGLKKWTYGLKQCISEPFLVKILQFEVHMQKENSFFFQHFSVILFDPIFMVEKTLFAKFVQHFWLWHCPDRFMIQNDKKTSITYFLQAILTEKEGIRDTVWKLRNFTLTLFWQKIRESNVVTLKIL